MVMQLARLGGATSLPVSGFARLLSRLTASGGVSGISASSGQAAKPNAPPSAPFGLSVPDGGGMTPLVTMLTVLAALIELVVLARLTVGEDFFSSLRRLR